MKSDIISKIKSSGIVRLLCLFLLISGQLHSQNIPQDHFCASEYHITDSIAGTITYKDDLKLLVYELTKNQGTELLKARAIFIWIADNIAYDYRAYNKNRRIKPFKCKDKNCTDKYAEWEEKLLKKVLNNKEAVCDGYARLFKKMCDYAGLRTDVVSGYIKNDPSHIGRMGILDHAWNSIIINGKYYFLDVTWAAGGCSEDDEGKLDAFHKNFNDYYWLTPTYKFLRNHYPAADNLPNIMTDSKQNYRNAPYIASQWMDEVNVISPDSGIITACVGDTLRFKIEFNPMLWQNVQINTNVKSNPDFLESQDETKQEYINFTQNNYVYEFKYIVDDKRLRYIDVLFDYRRYLRFNVKIEK